MTSAIPSYQCMAASLVPHRLIFKWPTMSSAFSTSSVNNNFANMASGVKLSDGVKLAYDDIKKHAKYLYAIFIIKVFCRTSGVLWHFTKSPLNPNKSFNENHFCRMARL